MRKAVTWFRVSVRCFAGAASLCLFVGLGQAAPYVTFEVPNCNGAITPLAINSADTVTGTCYNSLSSFFAFVRTADGTITNFAVDPNTPTTAVAIDEKGSIIGTAHDSIYHGYIRDPSGNFTVFDAPTATSTNPASINKHGAIAGGYTDSQGYTHGFVRSSDGRIATFDVHGHPQTHTYATSINDQGTIVGFSLDANGLYHGFVRAPDRTISTFDVPGFQMTLAGGINRDGVIVGLCGNSQALTGLIGFVRDVNGKFQTFTGRDGGAGMTQIAINKHGSVVTSYINPKTRFGRGLLRKENGKITVFAVNGASTYAMAINANGDTAGYFANSTSERIDGFIRQH